MFSYPLIADINHTRAVGKVSSIDKVCVSAAHVTNIL